MGKDPDQILKIHCWIRTKSFRIHNTDTHAIRPPKRNRLTFLLTCFWFAASQMRMQRRAEVKIISYLPRKLTTQS